MRILFLHPYGDPIGDWNHRLARQAELMAEVCDLKVMGFYVPPEHLGLSDADRDRINEAIDEFKPDILYINGYLVAFYCLDVFDKIVYDMGSYRCRNLLLDHHKITYVDSREMSAKELRKKLSWSYSAPEYKKENKVIQNVDEIIIWEGEEAELVRKIHGVDEKVNEISMVFYETPKPIPWSKKKNRAIAAAAQWGNRTKNGRLLYNVNEDIKIASVGHGGTWKEFMSHDRLMEEMNNSKVVFCPYICGGIGIINEALKMDCNVVLGSWHPYRIYANKELQIPYEGRVVGQAKRVVRKALKKRYLPEKKLPSERTQLDKVMKICEKVASK